MAVLETVVLLAASSPPPPGLEPSLSSPTSSLLKVGEGPRTPSDLYLASRFCEKTSYQIFADSSMEVMGEWEVLIRVRAGSC